jgi:hypothetical protein
MSYEDQLIRESVGDGTIDPDDVCMVCDKRDCVCPPEDEPTLKDEFMRPGAKEIGFPSLLESAENDRREILNAQVLSAFLAFCVVQCVAFAVATVVAT